jgi:hypothetical protein
LLVSFWLWAVEASESVARDRQFTETRECPPFQMGRLGKDLAI